MGEQIIISYTPELTIHGSLQHVFKNKMAAMCSEIDRWVLLFLNFRSNAASMMCHYIKTNIFSVQMKLLSLIKMIITKKGKTRVNWQKNGQSFAKYGQSWQTVILTSGHQKILLTQA